MKKIALIITALIYTISIHALSPVAQGKTNSELGYYIIENSGRLEMINGKALRTFKISYENSLDTIRVAIDDSQKGLTRFLVASEDLVIEYLCRDNFFGVSKTNDYFMSEGFYTSNDNLDKQQYYHQKLITQKPKTEIEYIKLISVYYPKLIKDYSKIYAKK